MPSASTVAMDSSLLFQVTALSVASSGNTVALMVCVLPTVSVPLVESNCISVGAVSTVILAVALTLPHVAVSVVVPLPTATTLLPFNLATLGSSTAKVMSVSVVSTGVSVYSISALSVRLITNSRLVKAIPCSGWLTVTGQLAVNFPSAEVTVTIVLPPLMPVSTPFSSTVAIESSPVSQFHVILSAAAFCAAGSASCLVS